MYYDNIKKYFFLGVIYLIESNLSFILRVSMSLERNNYSTHYDTLVEIVKELFQIIDTRYREDTSIEFVIEENETLKLNFKALIYKLKPLGYLALLRKQNNELVIRVGIAEKKAENKNSYVPLLLLIATVITVSIDGYFRTPSIPGYNFTFTMVLYIFGIMGIIGMHELSHKFAASKHGIRASLPYFIPGLPTVLPTFGAFISTRDPPINRDSLCTFKGI